MNEEKPIPASEWRAIERVNRTSAACSGSAWAQAYAAAADFCSREAEKAEAKEKCERGEHDPVISLPGMRRCYRCEAWIKVEPNEREQLRADVRGEIRRLSSKAFEPYHRVRAAELRDFYRRTFGDDCP